MTTLLFLLIGVIALSLLVGLVRLNPRVVYWAVSLFALTAWEFPNFGAIGTFGGTTVTLGDGLAVALFAAGLLDVRKAVRRVPPAVVFASILLVLLLAISLARGVMEYGLGLAVNEARGFIYVIGVIFWGVTREWTGAEVVFAEKFFVVVQGAGLCLVAAYHVARYGLGGTADFVVVSGELSQTGRPLVSSQAFMLVLCAVLALRLWNRSNQQRYILLFVTFMVVVAVSQQRTVWLTMVALAIVLLWRAPSALRRNLLPLAGLFLVVGFAIAVTRSASSDLVAEFVGSASNTGTYDARLTSWIGLVVQSLSGGPLGILFGVPFGHGYGRFEGVGRWVVFAPHNWYVTVYLREGLVGLIAFLAVIVPRIVAGLRPGRDVFVACILVCFLVYGWTYSWQWWTCLPLAFAFLDREFPRNDLEEAAPGVSGSRARVSR
ncbi:hypothetical protein DEJ25_11860 [Curtobacterium sp. MCPF17_011]|uniref:O-antigen ligase family protein n=1 Tax=Curtobacterium sp. MCPF17_011 TaxID=2175652 RepID=UPI000DAA253A|nr:O-antigen ligase family protein [Curtobacterium sp. MCPF17_011]PZF11069.1 hypothetical protein DEJ25_11860 [Curtobacterium sp. MCPF17_011]